MYNLLFIFIYNPDPEIKNKFCHQLIEDIDNSNQF